jgi:NADH-quinone oxidoreductase subunit M
MLTLVQRVFYGPQSKFATQPPALDLNAREQLNLWPLAILMLVMGVAPNLWLSHRNSVRKQSVGWASLKP